MRKLTKAAVTRLHAEANRPELWERVESFTNLVRPSAIRLTPTLAKRLKVLATFHGVGSAEGLAKRWLAERITYELELIEKARQQAG
jgi:hypothetical protein